VAEPRTEPADGLARLLGRYGEDDEQSFYDCEGPLEAAMAQMRWAGLTPQRGRDELAALLASGLPPDELARRTLPYGLPAGRSVAEFLGYLLTRVDAELAHPAPVDADPGMIDRPDHPMRHHSRFRDRETADRATTQVLRANEQRFRDWAADPAGVSRLWLAADLGEEVGTVTATERLAQRQLRGLGLPSDPVPEPVPATTCVTVLRMDHRSGRPVVLASYPELPVDPRAGERWPELTALFGGFFHQDAVAVDGSFWRAERRFHELSPAPVVAAVAAGLSRLLADAPDQAELGRRLHSLGSCTLPDDTVRWVTGLRRRITALTWDEAPTR